MSYRLGTYKYRFSVWVLGAALSKHARTERRNLKGEEKWKMRNVWRRKKDEEEGRSSELSDSFIIEFSFHLISPRLTCART